ncbi:hypothetical protein DEU56DRAFT_751291 [Suillus clintonianus]|uniref:uncharacterized protein n=1 Tax=Suillus clintonianus TaxID=1904413 RepID=UPI001B8768D9|nr:uncharacterized protein DEU56DRAFT_751291 [Suillus clintonianus]KAG2154606.1 hypothetical protein DEU56DRAFT_751291 [Suillus clintonianus]
MAHSDKENIKCLRSHSPDSETITGETTTDVKRPKRELIRCIPLEEIEKRLQNSSNQAASAHSGLGVFNDIHQTPIPPSISPKTPAPPYRRQNPAPVVVSQNYMHRIVEQWWDAEVRYCKAARKAQLLEVELAAHDIIKLV